MNDEIWDVLRFIGTTACVGFFLAGCLLIVARVLVDSSNLDNSGFFDE